MPGISEERKLDVSKQHPSHGDSALLKYSILQSRLHSEIRISLFCEFSQWDSFEKEKDEYS